MSKEELFNELQSKHKDWTDDQIWTTVSVMLSGQDVITEAGPNPPALEELLGIILERAKEWLLETLPDIFYKVCTFFDDLISSLPDWAKNGLNYIFKVIIRYYGGSEYYYDDYE